LRLKSSSHLARLPFRGDSSKNSFHDRAPPARESFSLGKICAPPEAFCPALRLCALVAPANAGGLTNGAQGI